MKHFAEPIHPIRKSCGDCSARDAGPCRWFDHALRDLLLKNSQQVHIPSGSTIIEQGEKNAFVGIILSGLVKVAMIDEDGDENVLQVLHRGQIVGDTVNRPDLLAYLAATEVELCLIPERTAKRLFDAHPEAYAAQLKVVLQQQLEAHVAQLALRGRTSLQRLAYWISAQLAAPADTSGPAPAHRLELILTRRDLASLLDMTIETLCRTLHQLEKRGAIRLITPKTLEIRDRRRLAIIAKDRDPKLKEAIQFDGWEWGAVAVNAGVHNPSSAKT